MGARAARYLNPGTRRLLEDPQLAGPERSPNCAAEASALLSSLRPSLGGAATLACPFPHGAAPTPDGEWAGDPPHGPGPGRAACSTDFRSSFSSALNFVPSCAAFLFLPSAWALGPGRPWGLSPPADFSPPCFRSPGAGSWPGRPFRGARGV